MEHIVLRNGYKIPFIGLGTWKIIERDLVCEVLSVAYEEGYRLIDTAAAYSNEISISKAIKNAGIGRQDLVLSDKVWNTDRGYVAVQDACKKSLRKLKTDYLDLYLVHWPASKRLYENWEYVNAETWRGLERLYKDGLVKSIGVCNYKIHHLEALKQNAEMMPFVNQIEIHPGLYSDDIVDYCKREGIVVEASSPLGNGRILENNILKSIAEEKGVTVAQICLRWLFQKSIVSIPKIINKERLKENIDIFGFDLSDEEMGTISSVPYCGGINIDPDGMEEFD